MPDSAHAERKNLWAARMSRFVLSIVSMRFPSRSIARIVAMALARRPDKNEQLYRVEFSCIDKREFLRLVSPARWVDCSPGEVILEKNGSAD
jgi:hypothetical protein